MKICLKLLAVSIMFLFIAACQNTMEGFGKDMQQNGDKIQHSAQN